MEQFIRLIERIGKKNIQVARLNGVVWLHIKTRGLLIDSFYNTVEDFGRIEFNGGAWENNEGSRDLSMDMWVNIISNCIGLMDIQ